MDDRKDEARTKANSPEGVWEEFQELLDSLPPKVRAAFLLRAVLEASDEEISARIGENTATCRHYLARARELVLASAYARGNTGASS